MMKKWLVGLLAVILCTAASQQFQLVVAPPPTKPTLAINGSTASNQSITGSTMTVSASAGPGGAREYLMV